MLRADGEARPSPAASLAPDCDLPTTDGTAAAAGPADSCRSTVAVRPPLGAGERVLRQSPAPWAPSPTALRSRVPDLELELVERITRRVDGHARRASALRTALGQRPRARPRRAAAASPPSGRCSMSVPAADPLVGPLLVEDQQAARAARAARAPAPATARSATAPRRRAPAAAAARRSACRGRSRW